MFSNELRDQQEGKTTRWVAFFVFWEDCLVSKRMFIPDGTPFFLSKCYILIQRKQLILDIAVCSATSVEFCSCRRAQRAWQKVRLRQWGSNSVRRLENESYPRLEVRATAPLFVYRSRDLNSFFSPALDTGPLWEYSNSNNLLPQCGKIRGKRDFAR